MIMNPLFTRSGLILLLAVLLAGAFLLGRFSTDSQPAPSEDPSTERTVLYWRAPMDPTEIYDQPGKSRMGMDLIPVYQADGEKPSSDTAVRIGAATVQNMGIRSAAVERMDLSHTIRTVGKVEYDEESIYIVNSKISGWIEQLHVTFEGTHVNKGDPLLEFYSPELVSTQQEFVLALENFRQVSHLGDTSIRADAEKLLESTRKRLEFWDFPVREIERLENHGEVTRTVLLRSPADGIVIEQHAVAGAYMQAGMDLYHIADVSEVWVEASVYDNDLPWVTLGQQAVMELSYIPGRIYKGRVSYIYPFLHEQERDVHIRMVFGNSDYSLKPGMFVDVELLSRPLPSTIVVPSEAVIRSGERTMVFVVKEQGTFEPREMLIGQEGGPGAGFVQVLSGLTEGEEVVISAQFLLDSESRLQEVTQKMLQERTTSE